MAAGDSGGGGFFGWAGGIVSAIYHAVTKDGVLGASLNQGRDELAMALKAFPDSIQGEQSGIVWGDAADKGVDSSRNSLYGQRNASQSQDSASPLPSPSDIAKDRPSSFQVAEREKGWVDKEMERREKAGNSGGDQNGQERARILPVEQQQEKGNGRGR